MAKRKLFKESEVYFVEKPNQVQFQDLEGRKFGRLTVMGYAGKITLSNWFCRCDCGNITKVYAGSLKSGDTTSCGCFNKERVREVKTTHGHNTKDKVSRTYRTWQNMLDRCKNPNSQQFKNYGGRGIQVCDRWQKFENFLADMGEKPNGLSLDRKDNDLGYFKENCRWATIVEQNNNKRTNRYLTFKRKTQTFAQWEHELGFNPSTIKNRLYSGWSVEKTLTTLKG